VPRPKVVNVEGVGQVLAALPWALQPREPQPRRAAERLLDRWLSAGWRSDDLVTAVRRQYDPQRPTARPYGLLRHLLERLDSRPPHERPVPVVVPLDNRLCPDGPVLARHCPFCRTGGEHR